MSLKGKSAIVTGSTSGIGQAIAEAFAAEGCNVMLNGFGDAGAIEKLRQDTAAKFGVSDRFSTIPGSAFEVDFGGGYDVILLPNFLHHFDPQGCTKLLKKCHAALGPGGRCVTVEFIPNDDRVSPPPAATFALTMLATTPTGDAYTYAEYEAMYRNAGYARSELQPLAPTMSRVVIGYK